jgi:hypothetical protein
MTTSERVAHLDRPRFLTRAQLDVAPQWKLEFVGIDCRKLSPNSRKKCAQGNGLQCFVTLGNQGWHRLKLFSLLDKPAVAPSFPGVTKL